MNKFAVVGFSGLAICVVCLSAAAAVGGKALRESGFDFDFDGKPRCNFALSGKSGERAIAWSGGDKVGLALPANAHYRPGSSHQVVVRGDTAVLPHVTVSDGDIKLDCSHAPGNRLEITLPGLTFRTFALAGSGNLTLDDIDQRDLKLRVAGSGDITASGKTEDLDIKIAGSGEARLGALAANRVELHVAGSGDVEIAPRDDLDVHVAGSGKVTLRTEPRTIESHIAGSGRIVHAAAP